MSFARRRYGIAITWWLVAGMFILIGLIEPIVQGEWTKVVVLLIALLTEFALIAFRVIKLLRSSEARRPGPA